MRGDHTVLRRAQAHLRTRGKCYSGNQLSFHHILRNPAIQFGPVRLMEIALPFLTRSGRWSLWRGLQVSTKGSLERLEKAVKPGRITIDVVVFLAKPATSFAHRFSAS